MKNGYQPKDNGKPLYPPTTGSRAYSPKYDDPMTFQEAYKTIQNDIKILARKNGRDIPDLLFVVSAALEKQIPKKIVNGACTCCNCAVWVDGNYCDVCGQRLDWSDEQ